MTRIRVSIVVAGELGVLFVGATLPSPLYPLYSATFGFGGVTLTLIYATYVLGNLAALLLGGRLSDQIGRRRAMAPALGLAIAGALVFLFAQNTAWLYAARILSGLATGLGSGAATAWLAELQPRGHRAAGAMLATAGNFLGTAVGPLLGGLLAAFAGWPLRLCYVVYLVLLAVAVPALWAAPETVTQRPPSASGASLRPRLGVPRQIRLEFLRPAVTAFVTFALVGFYAALVPSLLRDSLRLPSPAVSGGIICGLFLVATIVAAVSRGVAARTAMLWGLAMLLPSVALLVGVQVANSMPLLLAATACAGIAGALGYRGSLQVVNEIAPADRRSEVVSSYLIAVYLGNSVPIIGVGVLSAATSSAVAHAAFAAVIAALAVAALLAERGGFATAKAAE
ncbi:MAG: MFS transporter [Stellaceae bacterium]